MNLRQTITATMKHFALAAPGVARRQAIKLIRAKKYLDERGIAAADPKSKLVYTKSLGMFNPSVKVQS